MLAAAAKKPCLKHSCRCRNILVLPVREDFKFNSKSLHQALLKHNNMVHPSSSLLQLWDIDDDDDDASIACVANLNTPTANNTVLETFPLLGKVWDIHLSYP
jgi:hypothetical protein